MTREAINILKAYTDGKQNTEKVEVSVMQLNRVIKALEQEPCDDAISRQAVLSHIRTERGNGHEQPFDYVEADVIRQLPPVKPAEKVGHWIPVSEIEKIKSEINELSELDHTEPTYEDCKRDVLEIINKRTSGAKMQEVEE